MPALDTFEQALTEEGVDAEVTYEKNELTHTFYVSKQIAGNTITFTTSVSDKFDSVNSLEKEIALAAREVKHKFDIALTHEYEWSGKKISVTAYDSPEATCRCCGNTVEFSRTSNAVTKMAEASIPQPTPVDTKTILESIDEHSRTLLKMYLIGKLQQGCDEHC